VGASDGLSLRQRWARQPQKVWLRRALFQVHLWSGIALGLYILMISVTGSVLVYRNELFRWATPQPIISTGSGPRLTDTELAQDAVRIYPDYRVVHVGHTRNPDQAVDIWLRRGKEMKKRLFDARTGADVGRSVAIGISMVSWLLDLHDNLLGGDTGRKVNGLGAALLLVLAGTGIVVWWPGKKTWRRSLTVHRGVGWKRFTWHLHSMMGFWTFAFVVIFGLSGIYLVIPDTFQDWADKIQPMDFAHPKERMVDRVIYWLAYLHFGRINGIGIPCHGPGLCDQTTKAAWAFFGLAPAALFVTGVMIWWYRVVLPRRRAVARRAGPGPSAIAARSAESSGA
jgi:uncharacterized iron-regulated membrane protein